MQRMIDGVKKFGRALRRDSVSRAALVSCGLAIVAGALLGAITGGLVAGAIAGGVFSLVVAGAFVAGEELKMRRAKEIDLGYNIQDGIGYFLSLKGPGRKISVVANTQKLIERMAEKYAHELQLPAGVVQRLAPYLRDAEEAARDIRAPWGENDAYDLPQFEFVRDVFNASGQKDRQIVASVALLHTPTPWEIDKANMDAAREKREAIENAVAGVFAGTTAPIKVRRLQLRKSAATP